MHHIKFRAFTTLLSFLGISVVLANGEESQSALDDQSIDIQPVKTVKFDLLNKLSGKRFPITIPLGSSLVVHDIRIEPHACYHEKDPFYGMTYRVPLTIYLEQETPESELDESEDPVELYSGDITTNPRKGRRPIEHAIYDLILKECD